MATRHHCPVCGKLIAVEDRRRREADRLRPSEGCTLALAARQAPRVKCACGFTVILLKGSL